MGFKGWFGLLKQVYTNWSEDKAPRLAAALSYYTVFSLAPLLVVLIAIVGFVYGQQAAQNQIQSQIQGTVGPDAAGLIQTMITNTGDKTSGGIISTVIGIATLLFGAVGIFGQLKDSLNTIWDVQPPAGQGIMGYVKKEALSFLALLGVGLLLIASLLLSTVLATVGGLASNVLPVPPIVLNVANYAVSFAIITLLFALIYKLLPDAEIHWSDVWVGSLITAVLFVIGEILIGLYFTYAAVGSTYGAAGSLIALLLWVYYSAMILFFGAEITQVYANRFGSGLDSEANAQSSGGGSDQQSGSGSQTTSGDGRSDSSGRAA